MEEVRERWKISHPFAETKIKQVLNFWAGGRWVFYSQKTKILKKDNDHLNHFERLLKNHGS